MRDKQEILKDLRSDILDQPYKANAPLWLAYHTAEVFIDIRDILGRLAKAIAIVQASTPHHD